MGLLQAEERIQLRTLLLKLPNVNDAAFRKLLVAGFPPGLVQLIGFSSLATVDLQAMIDISDGDAWSQQKDGTWTVIRLVDNAISLVIGSRLESELQAFQDELKQRAIVREEDAQLQDALLAAFPSRTLAEQFVRSQYNRDLNTVTGGTSIGEIMAGLVKWAEREGRFELLRRAQHTNPADTHLQTLAAKFGLTPTTESAPQANVAPSHAPASMSDAQRAEVAMALLGAFPTNSSLERMVHFGLDANFSAIAAGASTLNNAIVQLLAWAEAQGRTNELVSAAHAANPGEPALRAVAEQRGLVPAAPAPQILERITAPYQFLNPNTWASRMTMAAQAVCRVQLPSSSLATGFLVGPSMVLTCFYVVEQLAGGPSDLTLRFDYQQTPDGVISEGIEYKLAADWLVAHSPLDVLDFALLRVDGAPGDDPVGGQTGASPRRWLVPGMAPDAVNGEQLFCLQHVEGGPLGVAVGEMVDPNAERKRIRYVMDTSGGSGGAPIFNSQLEVIAMHERKLIDDATNPTISGTNKEGILLSAIVARPEVQAALATR